MKYCHSCMFLAVIAMAGLLGANAPAHAQEGDGPRLTEVKLTGSSEFDDLSHVLRIKKVNGTFRLNERAERFRLTVLFYKDGKVAEIQPGLRSQLRGATRETVGADGHSSSQGSRAGSFTLQILDLDYLPLGDAEPEHYRFHVGLAADGLDGFTSYTKFDVPKSLFSTSPMFGTLVFSPPDGKSIEADDIATNYGKPYAHSILFSGHGNSSSIDSRKTLATFIKANPEADVFAVVLEFE